MRHARSGRRTSRSGLGVMSCWQSVGTLPLTCRCISERGKLGRRVAFMSVCAEAGREGELM